MRRLSTALAATLVALVATFAMIAAPSTAASAAEVPGSITSVTTDKTSYGYNERIKLTFAWAVPDSSSAGDTFTLDLPEELKAASLARFSLLAPDGSVVATAAWEGKSVLFTLTDYVNSHDGVSGSGFLTAEWDHAHTPETSQPIVLEFDSNVVPVVIGDKPTPCTTDCPPAPTTPTSRGLWKGGWWADGDYEGSRDESNNINWWIELPGGPDGFTGPIDVVDTPAAGSVVECDTIVIRTQSSLAGGAPRTPLDPSRYTLTCSPTGFSLHVDRILPNEFITLDYQGTITDQSAGSYGNHVDVTIAGKTTVKDSVMKRADAGGIGDGTQSVSVGDYVWLDENRDGAQDAKESGIAGVVLTLSGPDGKPVTSVTGEPVAPTHTDADGHYTFARLPVLSDDEHYTVTIDQAASAEALAELKPTLANVGTERATDSSTDSAESLSLTTNGAADMTLDFGFVRPVSPAVPTEPTPETPVATPTPDPVASTTPLAPQNTAAKPAGGLAITGADGVAGLVAAALALLVLGSFGAVAQRRRAAAQRDS